jgi:nicotinamidase-related amidase
MRPTRSVHDLEAAMTHVADTIPYPWPYDGGAGLAPARTALVVTGAQRRWIALDHDGALTRIVGCADALRPLGVAVVFVTHVRSGHARRPGADLPLATDTDAVLAVRAAEGDLVVDTPAHDGFLSGRLDHELRARRRDHLLFAGFGAEVLLDSTLRSANDRGYECLTLADAAVPFDPETGARALASITMSGGIFGAVGTTGAVLAAFGVTAPEEVPR